ncbi:MAG: thioesterase family protein [Bacteroidota bacterium]
MKSFTEILTSNQFIEGQGQSYSLDQGWMQGRAVYGGLSTALCLHGTLAQIDNLPPLRSVSVNFIGPASEEVYVKSQILRQGKSVSFVRAELMGENGLINNTLFSFGAERASKLDQIFSDPRKVPNPASLQNFFPENKFNPKENVGPPSFTQHFEVRMLKGSWPFSGSDSSSLELWVKHKDTAANDLVALLALADMPPPAVSPLFKTFAPISSMSWMMNLLSDDLSNESGWWLLGVYAEHASQGYSSQNMTIHNDKGELVVVGRQNVAVFY